MIPYKHNWYELFPKHHQTEFIYFIDLAELFLLYVNDRNRSQLRDNFCPIFYDGSSYGMPPRFREMINDFYNTFTCDCDNCLEEKLGDNPEQGAYSKVRAFVTELVTLMNLEGYNQRIMQATVCDEFKEDFRTIVANLLNTTQTLQQAEISLLYWAGIVPDDLMQSGLLYMRYTYLMHLLQK